MRRSLHNPSSIIVKLLLSATLIFGVMIGAQANMADPQINIQWQFKTDAAIWAPSTTIKGTTYFGSTDGNLYALNTKSGKQIFTTTQLWTGCP